MNKYNFLLECRTFWTSFLVQCFYFIKSIAWYISQEFQEAAVFLWDEAVVLVGMFKKTLSAKTVI